MLNRTLAHYEIIEKLGQGGMGEVYRARDRKLGRDVALKILPEDVAADPERRKRFEREARAVAALKHPNIITLHSIEEADGVQFITMEYVEGVTLSADIIKGGLQLDRFLDIAIPLADALASAHAKGIAHRDLKPENIMRDKDGRLKILDFGLAKLFESNLESDETIVDKTGNVTKQGLIFGTAAYMSPEQAEGLTIDARSDIFSFGVILYQTATGTHPFQGRTTVSTISAILKDDPVSVSELRPSLPPLLGAIIGRCLAKDPKHRYQSALDIGKELDRLRREIQSGDATEASSASDRRAIVVLPFADLSPDAENEYFSDGLTEEIIADLSKVRALSVISRTSAMQLKGTEKDVRTIGRELDVRYVLEGSVRKAGNSLRITAQLIDAHTDMHLWAEKYSGTMDDVFDLQERVSREIVGSLDVTLTSDEDRRLGDHPIADVRAFELYLQARQELRRHRPEAIERASNLLAQAVEIEGETPPLRALRAWAKVTEVRSGLNRDLQPLDEAEAEGHALLALAPDASYGHALLGYIEYERGHQPQAVKHFLSALEREPNDADTLFYLGISYNAAGQTERATETSKKFIACDPLAPLAWLLSGATLMWFIGRHEEALKSLQRGLEIDPQNLLIHWCIGYTYASLGQLSEAVKHVTWMRESAPDVPYTRQLQALVEALNGEKERAMECLAPVDVAPLDAHNKFHLAESFAMADAIDPALDLLERAVDEGFYPYPFIAEHCPFMEPLRGTPRFAAILAKARRQKESFEQVVGP